MDERDTEDHEEWGPLVRLYAVTRGRTPSKKHDLQLTSLVKTRKDIDPLAMSRLEYEHRQILGWCQRPLSLAEISSYLHLPLSVAKILVVDLIERNLLTLHSPAATPDVRVLMAVINGIRQL